MGFSELWKLYDEADAQLRARIDRFICCDAPVEASPWLVIDFSNVDFTIGRKSGGHRSVFESYALSFWRAIFFSNFKIFVVRDGGHCAERAVLKLDRMMKSCRWFDPTRDDIQMDTSLYFSSAAIFTQVQAEAREFYGERLVYRDCVAPEEADDVIKRFCTEVTDTHVIILSDDTSLVLGQDDRKFIVRMSRLVLREKTGSPLSYPMLFGAAFQLSAICANLSRVLYQNLHAVGVRGAIIEDLKPVPAASATGATGAAVPVRVAPINAQTLALIASLLDSEYSDIDQRESQHSPYQLINFFKNFLFPYEHSLRDRTGRKLGDLVAAAVVVLLFTQHRRDQGLPIEGLEGFEVLMEEVKVVATALVNREAAGNQLWTLRKGNPKPFPNVCRSLLESLQPAEVMLVLRRRLATLLYVPASTSTSTTTSPSEGEGEGHVVYRAEVTVRTALEASVEGGLTTAQQMQPATTLWQQLAAARRVATAAATSTSTTAISPPEAAQVNPTDAAAFNRWFTQLLRSSPRGKLNPHQYWASQLSLTCPEDVPVFTRHQLFEYVLQHDHVLPERGYLLLPELLPVPAPVPTPAGGEGAEAATAVTPAEPSPSASSSPRVGVLFELITDQRAVLLREDGSPSSLQAICSVEAADVWSDAAAAGPHTNLLARAQLLRELASGDVRKRIPVPDRKANEVVEVLLLVGGGVVQAVAEALSKAWKTKTSTFKDCFEDSTQLKLCTLGAASVLVSFHSCFQNHPLLSPRVLECLIDGIILAPWFAAHSKANCAVLGSVNDNLVQYHRSLLSTLSDRNQGSLKLAHFWVERVHVLLLAVLDLASHEHQLGKDLAAWFDGLGLSLVLQLGLRAPASVASTQCAAVWCEPLLEFLGKGSVPLEPLVASVSKARGDVVTALRA